MTFEELRRSVEAHDRQLGTVVGLLASLAERLSALVRVSELQDTRLRRLEDTRH